jgi:hypothetical protein
MMCTGNARTGAKACVTEGRHVLGISLFWIPLHHHTYPLAIVGRTRQGKCGTLGHHPATPMAGVEPGRGPPVWRSRLGLARGEGCGTPAERKVGTRSGTTKVIAQWLVCYDAW